MKKWIGNISYSFAGKILAMAFLMLLDVAAARMLKIEQYAEWAYFFAILTMMFYVGWLGINNSSKVSVSKLTNTKDVGSFVASTILLRFVISVTIALAFAVVMPNISRYLGYPETYPNLRELFILAPWLVFFNGFTEYFKGVFIGLNRFSGVFAITVLEYLGYFIFSLVFLFVERSSRSIGKGYLVSGVIVFWTGICLLYKTCIKNCNKISISYEKYILPVFKYAIPIAIISFGGMILVEMDSFMLGLLSSSENVATYSIAKNLCSKATHVNYALTVGVMTSFSVITAGNYDKYKADFKKAVKANFVITLVVVLCFLIFGDVAIKTIYGNKYAGAGYIIRILTVYYALYGISNFFSNFLDFRNKAGVRSVAYSSVVIINLLLNYMWIPVYGAKGAAWATDLSLLPYTIYVTAAVLKEWKIDIPKDM